MSLAPYVVTRFTWKMWPRMLNSFRKCSWCYGTIAIRRRQAVAARRVEFAVGDLLLVVAVTPALEAAATLSVLAQKLGKSVPGHLDPLLINQIVWWVHRLLADCSRLLGHKTRRHCNKNVEWALMTVGLELQS
jgi:hypothetical protein